MFKKVFQTLSKTFAGKEDRRQDAAAPAKDNTGSILNKLGAAPPAERKKAAAKPAAPTQSPEELCGVTPAMTKDQVRARLAMLYRRHNRATSSLDAKLRAEAEKMLGAIVMVREKQFGPI